jgi:hypothetical protein
VLFIVDKRARIRIEICGITDLVLIDPEVVMKEDANLAPFGMKIRYAHAAEKYVVVTRDGVVAVDAKTQLLVLELDIRDERVGNVSQSTGPFIAEDPGKIPGGPHAETERESLGVILLPDVGEIYVAYLVFVVECDEQGTISDWNVTHVLV